MTLKATRIERQRSTRPDLALNHITSLRHFELKSWVIVCGAVQCDFVFLSDCCGIDKATCWKFGVRANVLTVVGCGE